MLGDKAYDSAELREELDEHGTKSVIPNRSNRKQPFSFSKRLYTLRWRIEAAFNRLKDFRRVATRYDRHSPSSIVYNCSTGFETLRHRRAEPREAGMRERGDGRRSVRPLPKR